MLEQQIVSRAELVALVERAATPTERLSEAFIPVATAEDDAVVGRRLDAWRKAIGGEKAGMFARRLEWDGLDMESARRAVGAVTLPEDAPLPGWALLLAEVVAESSASPAKRFIRPEAPLPFEETLGRFVLVARRRLAGAPGYDLLAASAHADLEVSLLQQLCEDAAQALYFEFSILRSREQALQRRTRKVDPDPSGRRVYSQLAARLEGRGLLDQLATYPVLARMLGTITLLWVEAQAEFLARLREDSDAIGPTFAANAQPGMVVAVRSGLSDPHRGRRSVLVLTFAAGLKLVYKPKSLAMDGAFSNIASWLVAQGAPFPLRCPLLLERDDYGWVEFIERRDCRDQAEVGRYFRHAGALLALIYTLEGTDCHAENIIAEGYRPVLIDLEMLAQPYLRQGSSGGAADEEVRLWEQQDRSVLRTQMLPRLVLGFGGADVADVGGLGRGDGPEGRILSWIDSNTDRMRRDYVPSRLDLFSTPRLDGRGADSSHYVEDIVTGFRQMYLFLVQIRTALLAEGSPLYELADIPVRVIYRPTMVCVRLLKQLRQPKYLGDGADWGIGSEVLTRLAVWYESMGTAPARRPLYWPTLAVEQWALTLGDVPYFTASTGGTALELGDGREIPGAFAQAGFSLLLERIASLGAEDMTRQIGLISASYLSYAPTPVYLPELAAQDTPAIGKQTLLEAAHAIGADMAARAIRDPDGSVSWITPQLVGQLSIIQLLPLGADLYDGVGGIALFLAALAAVTGDASFRELALAATVPLCREPEGELLIGGAEGLGSIIYSLAHCAALLEQPKLRLAARGVAALITPKRIAADTRLDVIAGAAGAILGILALDPALHDPDLRERARLCGEHLLAQQVAGPSGGSAWPTLHDRLLGGFGHGAAGIAYALQRLYVATSDSRLLLAADAAMAYEATIFTPERGDWLDLRVTEQPAYFTGWCNGAPGIALARLGGLRVAASERGGSDVEVALNATLDAGLHHSDHLCCGNMSLVETLLVAGQQLQRPDLQDAALDLAGATLRRAQQQGSYALETLRINVWRPGLYSGSAGIGYQLLRLAEPQRLASLLLWEPPTGAPGDYL